MTGRTRERALRTRFAERVAVVVEAREGADAPGAAGARPVGADPIAAWMITLALHVTRRCVAGEGARAAFGAQSLAVGTRTGAVRPLLARDVARRAVARELALAAGPTFTVSVAALGHAVRIVALAEGVTRRCVADELARAALRAHALASMAFRSAMARRRQQRRDDGQEQPQPESLHPPMVGGVARRVTGGAITDAGLLRARRWPYCRPCTRRPGFSPDRARRRRCR